MSLKLWYIYGAALLAAVAAAPVTFINAWAGVALAALAFGAMVLVVRKSGTTLRIKQRR